jgi:hypothetical protein
MREIWGMRTEEVLRFILWLASIVGGMIFISWALGR